MTTSGVYYILNCVIVGAIIFTVKLKSKNLEKMEPFIMDIIKKYGGMIRRKAESEPEKALRMFRIGFGLEYQKASHLANRRLPAGYREVYRSAVKKTNEVLSEPSKSVWTNIFGPVEIFQCFGLNPTSLEMLSGFMSGFQTEDYFIDLAEDAGIASTLCSYHKHFIGTVASGVMPSPAFIAVTSSVCDGNINTMRYAAKKRGMDYFAIDVPHNDSPEAEKYVAEQLYDMIAELEKVTGKKFHMDELSETIRRENESKRLYQSFVSQSVRRWYPNTLTALTAMLYPTHLSIGSQEALKLFRLLERDISNYPEKEINRVMWVHLLPYYQETLREYFNLSERNYISVYDFTLDYMEEMDEYHPVEAIARKMIRNIYNGDYSRKIRMISELADEFRPNGVIHYCHWGCKQSSGGVMMLREHLTKQGIPMLVLDGDALDRRNDQEGQLKTRLEAFLEMVENRRNLG